jgi:signal transduction histidine kinase
VSEIPRFLGAPKGPTELRHHSPLERGLGRTLLSWFLAVSLIPLAVVTVFNYSAAYQGLREGIMDSLGAVTRIKASYISSYFEGLKADLDSEARRSDSKLFLALLQQGFAGSGLSLREFVQDESWRKLVENDGAGFRSFREQQGCRDVLLVSADGSVLFTILKEDDLGANLFRGRYADTLLAAACRRALETNTSQFSDFEPYAPFGGEIAGFLVSPIRDESGPPLGLLALRVPIDRMDAIMQMGHGLGGGGKSYLVGEDLIMRSNLSGCEHPTILNELADTVQTRTWLRHHAGACRPLICEMEVPIRYADHTGKRVVGSHAALSIGNVRMGVIAELEEREAFAAVARLRTIAVVVGLLAVLVVTLGAVFVTRSIVDPIHELHEGTEIIGDGDLDFRVGTDSQNEIGQLSRAFDEMVDELKLTMASRDELNVEIAQRQRIESELARSNKELEAFGYSASHDLQEPLRKIIAFSDRVKAGCAERLDEKYADYLDRVQNAAYRMQALINALLAYSRVTTKAKPFEPVDLAAVAEGVREDLEYRIAETGATVNFTGLPTLDAEPVQMQQLLQNLIGNALKFQREGVPPVIDVIGELTRDGATGTEACRIVFRDNGVGFDPKYRDRVFEVFQRLHARGTYEGTGIGLALCRKIVDRHVGTIEVDSVPGEGTTFTVTLPLHLS